MNIDDFEIDQGITLWKKTYPRYNHKHLPITVSRLDTDKVRWFYLTQKKIGNNVIIKEIHELYKKEIHEVSEQEISLLLLKYSML